MTPARLSVVSSAAWLARELAVADGVEVIRHAGLDLDGDPTAWWCPGAFAMRLHATGRQPLLRSPGPRLLTGLPPWALGRRVERARVLDLVRSQHPVFAKPADTKVPGLTARVWPEGSFFADHAIACGLYLTSPVLVSDPITLVSEHRVFVLDGAPVASSVYLDGEVTWESLVVDPGRDEQAQAFVREVLAVADPATLCSGFVLDVGVTDTGRWVVIEANPSWSSNPYWCSERDPDAVVRTVLAGQGPTSTGPLWRPDPSLARRARALPTTDRATRTH